MNFWGQTIHYHRPLFYYVQHLERNSMCVYALHAPISDICDGEQDPDALSHLRIPSFMVIKAGKL